MATLAEEIAHLAATVLQAIPLGPISSIGSLLKSLVATAIQVKFNRQRCLRLAQRCLLMAQTLATRGDPMNPHVIALKTYVFTSSSPMKRY